MTTRRIRTYHEVAEPVGAELLDQVVHQQNRLAERLARVRHVVTIASGKGGVGKSVVTANLAAALGRRGRRVGAADADLNGPSLARMLGVEPGRLRVDGDGVHPASGAGGCRLMSMDLLLGSPDAPVRWREPAEGAFIWQSALETGTLREFLADVAWGDLDYLLVDVPPGTDKLARLLQLVPAPSSVLLVTTPSEMARAVVARSVHLVRDAGVRVIGLAANMTAYVCARCGREDPLFDADGARRLSEEAAVPLWAEIPFDPRLAASTDSGMPFVLADPGTPAARALLALADRLEREVEATADEAAGRDSAVAASTDSDDAPPSAAGSRPSAGGRS